jgi:hypothetical protein
MHLLRLLQTGLELLKTGELHVRRPDSDQLTAVRDGSLSFDALQRRATELEAEMQAAARPSQTRWTTTSWTGSHSSCSSQSDPLPSIRYNRIVLDLLLCVAVATGLWRAVRARHRYAVICGVVLGYVLLADLLAALAVSKPHQIFDLFSVMFLGPLSAPERAVSLVPFPALAIHYPLAVRATRIVLSSLAAWRCLRESSQLNPLLPRAYVLDAIAMPFAGAGVLDVLEGVLLLWAFALASRS